MLGKRDSIFDLRFEKTFHHPCGDSTKSSTINMFAVPGWSVSSENLKTQSQRSVEAATNGGIDPTTKSSKKRKRDSSKSKALVVTPTNLADLWDTVIEGKSEPKTEASAIAQKSKISTKGHGEKCQKIADSDEQFRNEHLGKESGSNGLTKKIKSLKEKKREKKEALRQSKDFTADAPTPPEAISNPLPPKPYAQLTPLQASMRQKLISARFRYLNETLYTTPSSHSLEIFKQNPEMFHEYHEGFRQQVEVWPENPVDGFSEEIQVRGRQRGSKGAVEAKGSMSVTPLPRTEGRSHIADLGCGDAALAQGLQETAKKLKLRIYSYDLHNPSPFVTKADIANLPLQDNSIDVAIFCLALMGTNWIDFVEEAFRVLRWKGELWVSEIKSRFGRVGNVRQKRVEHSVGNRSRTPDKKALKRQEEEVDEKDLAVEVDGQDNNKQETDVSAFVEVLRRRGFVLHREPDLRNKMFVKLHFVKGLTPVKGKCVPIPKGMAEMGMETWKKKVKGKFIEEEETLVSSESGILKPCVYKLR